MILTKVVNIIVQVVVFVVSSTGEGDPPENFEDFWVALNTAPPRNLTFSVLGLGDSNYTEFGGFPTALQQFLTGWCYIRSMFLTLSNK